MGGLRAMPRASIVLVQSPLCPMPILIYTVPSHRHILPLPLLAYSLTRKTQRPSPFAYLLHSSSLSYLPSLSLTDSPAHAQSSLTGSSSIRFSTNFARLSPS